MKIAIINGPNLNMLGVREPDHYGKKTYKYLIKIIKRHCKSKGIKPIIYQSNHEGAIVDKIQKLYKKVDGIVINPGAYTHTSIAILDALKTVSIPTVEVHISKIEEREDFRQVSYIKQIAIKTITGEGLDGYIQAIDFLLRREDNE